MKKAIAWFMILMLITTNALAYDELSKGSRGENVVKLQQALIDQGFLTGNADGDFGKKTAAAVSSFQKSQGLPETGIADDTTQSVLYGNMANSTTGLLEDDHCVTDIFIHFADSLAKSSYREVKEYLDKQGYVYDTTIGGDDLATFKLQCSKGSLYIGFYPLSYEDSAFGNPDQEILSAIEYSRDDKWITISDSMHIDGGKLSTGDKSRDTVNQEVASLSDLVAFYNTEIGGSITLSGETSISTEASRQAEVESTVKARIKEYTGTTIQRMDVNSNAGTSDPDDFIVLIYFNWSVTNSIPTTKKMLEMFSDDMAVTLAQAYEHASEVTLFWEVPYLYTNGTCAKYSYSISNGNAYRTETFGPLYY